MKRYVEVNKLYKDALNGKISGVCSGLARYLSVPSLLVRVVAVVCLLAMPVVTAVSYIAATILIPSR